MRIGISVLAFALFGAAAAAAGTCPPESTLTLRGTVRDIQLISEEPQAELETFFEIQLAEPVCGKPTVTASTIGTISCRDGDVIEATGQFSPPSPMFGIARIKLAQPVICRGRP